jgi:hypothetical protein
MASHKRKYVPCRFIEPLLCESGNKSNDICNEVDKDNFVESGCEDYVPESEERLM